MAKRKQDREQTLKREVFASERRNWGWTEQRIADHLGITQQAVNQIFKRIDARYLKQVAENVEQYKVKVDGQLGYIIEEMGDAWRQSKEPQRKVRQTTDADGNEVTVTELIEREGNVVFVDRLLEAQDRRMKLWGLNVNAADQELTASVASMAASLAARDAAYESRQSQEGNPQSPPAHPAGEAGEVQDRPGSVQ